ncbi:MAG: caspase family protein [Gemmatimonadales bacterium]
MSSSGRLRRAGGLIALAAFALGACAEAEKTGEVTKSLAPAGGAMKSGVSMAARSAQSGTTMVNGEAQKGVARITPGQTQRGSLASSDGKLDNGAFVDVWVFEVTGPSDVIVALSSDAFDTYLALLTGAPGATNPEVLAMNDDLVGTNSGVAVEVGPGTYSAMASSYSGGATGDYQITLEVLANGSDEARVLSPGAPASGDLVGSDPTFDDGSHYQAWTLQGQAGDRLTVSLSSDDFDTYVIVRQGDQVLASNDDSDGTNSRVEVTLPSTGAYTVVATSYGGGETGRYTLQAQADHRAPFAGFRTGGDPKGRYALLVGIGDYPGTDADLGNAPIEDANIMRRMLVDHFGFDPANIVMLSDGDATRENIAQGIAQHLGQAGPDGLAFFFYSGHGTQIGENVGVTGALDPENEEGDQAIYVYGSDYESSVILDEELGYLIETIDAGRTMVAIDACFSGSITRASGTAPQSKRVDLSDPAIAAHTRIPGNFITSELKALNLTDTSIGFGDFGRIARVMENPQRHVMWGASTDEQVSWTSELGGGSSVFAYYLGQRLTAAPGSATLAQVHRQVRDDVVGYTRENTELQEPQLRGDRQSMTVAEFFRQR